MPLVSLSVRKPKTSAFNAAVLEGMHQALVASGVPKEDRFHRVLELLADDFRHDPAYPDLTRARDDDFVPIEILLSVGHSVKVKRKIPADLMAHVSRNPGLDPENVMVVFKETQRENWAFGGGRQIHI